MRGWGWERENIYTRELILKWFDNVERKYAKSPSEIYPLQKKKNTFNK